MSPDAELMLIFGTLHLIAVALGALLFVMFLRSEATKPWLSGAIYFALQEFRVRPNWDGGNPRPQSPIHQKGLVSFDGVRKPAFFDVQRIFLATKQFRAVPRSGL